MPKAEKELKFVRLRNIADDLVGYVTYKDECISIARPLTIIIDTIFEEGRQILSLQEFLPQSIIEIQEIEFPLEDILFITPVREEFYEQYEYVSEFFYDNVSNLKKPKIVGRDKEPKEENPANIEEKLGKVVSIIEALAKKDKGTTH